MGAHARSGVTPATRETSLHRDLRNFLTDAEGESDQVVVVFLDVRGFSSFAGMAESSQAALFLRAMYIEVLDQYFPDAAFFKPTGDGLMIIRHIDRQTLGNVVNESIAKSLELVNEFPTITADDPMVNFRVPGDLGIGIARGAATRLSSGDHTLDYSGRPLNLAARLMDLARPMGVVVDGAALKGVDLSDDLAGEFHQESVYVKGIADSESIDVFVSDAVRIKSHNKRPLVGVPYRQEVDSITFRDMSRLTNFVHSCEKEPIDPDAVRLEVIVPAVRENGTRDPETVRFLPISPMEVIRTPDGWDVVFDYGVATRYAERNGMKPTWKVERCLRYLVAEAESAADVTPSTTAAEVVEADITVEP